ncbi:MauE/DoxX family redox-associated membrane protein [Nonomuraea sp. MG754425]|uniref:MauE/DoxX family redox-associated membrane protein n=1 Tax=Nonomuraea sp. MG754425 TaxID=2570319 RepID=UPI001F3ECF86|nr:MauE/DoxX family redox-associated membrane protein [Nonomuraea sp. MG754425]
MLDPLARVLLAVVFIAAVVGKTRSRQGFAGFRDSVAAIGPRWLPTGPVAGAVVAGEAATVVLLAVPGTRLAGYALAAALLLVFCAGIGRAVLARQSVRCQCFGADGGLLGPRHLVRNGLLVAVAAAGALAGGGPAAAPATLAGLVAGAFLGLLTTRWEDVAFLLVPAGRNR